MKKAKIIYQEENILTIKYYKPKFYEYMEYDTTIKIKDSGKNKIEMFLSFDGTPPGIGVMPPEEHTIKASSILELHRKLVRWLKKYGYVFA